MHILAYSLFSAGVFVSVLNFYLSFVRPLICHLRRQEYRFISGLPAVGSLLLVASFFCFPSGHYVGWAALVIALFDTGGIHWFCGTMLYQSTRSNNDS
jgi:membrane-associated phospholipid phosphatase